MGDEADLEQLQIEQFAALGTGAAGAGAVAEREAAHGAAPQRETRGAVRIVHRGDDAQAAVVLGGGFDPADPQVGPVLPEQRQRIAPLGKRPGEGAGADQVAPGVAPAEQGGVAREAQGVLSLSKHHRSNSPTPRRTARPSSSSASTPRTIQPMAAAWALALASRQA